MEPCRYRVILICCAALLLLNCGGSAPRDLVLLDFESDRELDRIHWDCHTLLSLSDRHVSHGSKSLKLELFTSEYPGLSPVLGENDWRGYRALLFDIYNPQENAVRITVRIDDREDYPEYRDRYNGGFTLAPGPNRIRIPLGALTTPGAARRLDLGEIRRLFIFTARPERKVVLFVDYIRLLGAPESRGKGGIQGSL
ncbi:MAG TPA: hypothetical protein VF790_02865 [Dissulfurispiraceae bacterium]